MPQPSGRKRGRPRAQFSESSAGTLQSLDRALSALSALARSEGATLSDLARGTAIPTATLHRILTTLAAHGYAGFDAARQEWAVGVEAYRTGAAFLKRSNLLEAGRPVMRRLMQETGETANIAVPDAAQVVFIGQVETPNPIRAFFPPGTRTSMHASGTGKAILAAMRASERARLLAAMDYTAHTPSTLASEHALCADLALTAERGWSHDREERHPGMSCIGAAIHDETGQPRAGISVSGPTARFEPARVGLLGRLVADAAREITLATGGSAP